MAALDSIPEPRALPFIGHTHLIQPYKLNESVMQIARDFDGIFRLRFPGTDLVFVSNQALVNEICDESRFQKKIGLVLGHLRPGLKNGLFTADTHEEAWGIAHRVLTPAFGPLKIRDMFEEMHEVATQLALKWARGGASTNINVTEDFTRLTLDTIALCSMGYRFNSFYSSEMHPFVRAMVDFLLEAGDRGTRSLPGMFYRSEAQKFDKDIEIMRSTAQEVLDARKSGQTVRDHDLLAAMLKGIDSQTGQRVSDDSIINNLITFLVAGHETTSGMLSYTFYHLLKNPETFAKAQQEVDSVCGKGPVTLAHISKLGYINGALREALRIDSTIPAMGLSPKEDTTLGGKYFVKKDQQIIAQVALSNRDPAVYGEDSYEFKPERMMEENFNRLNREFPNCWKPFGNGKRSCIGRAFAWQEALIIMAVLLQNFDFTLEPNDYVLQHKESLTLKPDGLKMRATLRDNLTPQALERRLIGSSTKLDLPSKPQHVLADHQNMGVPMTVLYGSNTGTCKALAQKLAADAAMHGFRAVKLDSLDSAQGSLPPDHPVVMVTASYEGEPPDNAERFVSWIISRKESEEGFESVSYAVFGCGNSEWVNSFHKIPTLVDTRLEELGAQRLVELGKTNVSTGAAFTDFEVWEDDILWPALKERYGTSGSTTERSNLDVMVSNTRTAILQQNLKQAVIVESKPLTKGCEERFTKMHLEVKLPKGMTYQTGDYLVVLPFNPSETVQRAMRRLRLSRDSYLEITSNSPVSLPVETSMPAGEVLASYVELKQPATKGNIAKLAEIADNDDTIQKLRYLASDGFNKEIIDKKVSVLELLERFPALPIPPWLFLSMLSPMNVRQYSISSSSLENPNNATITFSILREPSLSGNGLHIGAATSYLSHLGENDFIEVGVRPSHAAFSLPADPENTPLILAGAGAGIAPFRGFIQERAHMIASGRMLAQAVLFIGCRSPDLDELYREELDEWQRLGAVEVHRAYSRVPTPKTEAYGCKYVQDRMWRDRGQIAKMWKKGAKIVVCGSKGMGDCVKDCVIRMKKEGYLDETEKDDKRVQEWFQRLRNVRYVADIFD
ncbi:unnamed protein product [Clonostachys byssicola]|uniref:Bifunctional cytochrome P450/NADPH--P450 reductase n=1 Tax=Clonostachys byssicola TaxID=160290 RepID=A0A9N9UEN0_9HYPO|nr:unnamed protein product [Clonostachys byssicola]